MSTTASAAARFACVDVDYRVRGAVAGCVLFAAWTDATSVRDLVATARADEVAAYVPGQLYLRELPLLERVLAQVIDPLDVVIVDGNVWLDGAGAPGLGAHLWNARGQRGAVIGVAKTSYVGAPAVPLLRGSSTNPLHITAAGMDPGDAAARIAEMDGPFRLPTLLTRVDRLCRDATLPSTS
ncbi:MAG TPA: endonuclease V [Kofleriaceae bacterium]|nr:endonuclease V [Kofleriaceae bacterium]